MKSLKQWGVFAFAIVATSGLASAQVQLGIDTGGDEKPQYALAAANSEGDAAEAEATDPAPIYQMSPCGSSCSTGCAPMGCTQSCGSCGQRVQPWIFADYLYLSATDVDTNYTIPVNALGTTGTPVGAAAFASPGYDSGFRVGGGWGLDGCTSIVGTYWWFESEESDAVALDPAVSGTTQFLSPVLFDPATINVTGESARAEAFYDIDFQMVDLAVQRIISCGCSHEISAFAGARWGQLDQELRTNYSILGGTTVDSTIDFDGIGPRLGLNGEFRTDSGFFAYGQGAGNFLVGTFDADFLQQNTFAGIQSNTSFEDDRIVSVLELELGVGWQTSGGMLRVRGGYYISSWFNAMTMPEVIAGVHDRNLNDVSESLTFNGLTTRLELRF